MIKIRLIILHIEVDENIVEEEMLAVVLVVEVGVPLKIRENSKFYKNLNAD